MLWVSIWMDVLRLCSSHRVALVGMDRNSPGATRGRITVLSFRPRKTFCSRTPRTNAANIDRSACSFSRSQYFLCFNRGVRLRVPAGDWRTDAARVGDTFMRYDHGDCDERDPKCQGIVSGCMACGIFIPTGATLPGSSRLAFLFRAGMA